MKSGAIAPVSVAPAAAISDVCWDCDVPLANVTMYGTVGPLGAAVVVVVCAAVVVEVVDVVAVDVVTVDVVAVEVVPLEVVSVAVVPVAVVPVAVVPVWVVPVEVESFAAAALAAVDVEELSLGVELELENVLPSVIGDTSPKAPETRRPTMKMAVRPIAKRTCLLPERSGPDFRCRIRKTPQPLPKPVVYPIGSFRYLRIHASRKTPEHWTSGRSDPGQVRQPDPGTCIFLPETRSRSVR
jgi:hypothetical protein